MEEQEEGAKEKEEAEEEEEEEEVVEEQTLGPFTQETRPLIPTRPLTARKMPRVQRALIRWKGRWKA